jgi:methylenetetrahydrofolate dehydrogenase (NADP+)/methenyltetrahydrofolate cyclohydrolase
MVRYFMERKATVISMNSSSPEPKDLTGKADIVVCAAGRPKFMDKTWFREGAIVVDASTSESDGQLAGDVDTEDVQDKVILCPSPKGIGPLTVRYIFSNLVRLGKG